MRGAPGTRWRTVRLSILPGLLGCGLELLHRQRDRARPGVVAIRPRREHQADRALRDLLGDWEVDIGTGLVLRFSDRRPRAGSAAPGRHDTLDQGVLLLQQPLVGVVGDDVYLVDGGDVSPFPEGKAEAAPEDLLGERL